MSRSSTGRTGIVDRRKPAHSVEPDLLAKVKAAASGVREELVAELREQIRNGSYSAPAAEVAESMLFHLEALREETKPPIP
jgi:anti-sigma28 factor (negative regulator of flagellin synthesis)